jgi:hypothetical protein
MLDANCFANGTTMTRAELLRHALSQALRKVHAGRQKLKLDENMRWQVAGEAVEELRRYGGWKELDVEAPMRPLAPGSGPHDRREKTKP